MFAPPFDAGAVHTAKAVRAPPAEPRVGVPMVGCPGTVAGVTLFDAADSALVPAAFTAETRKLYAVPLVNPVTVAVVPLTVIEPAGRVVTMVVPVRTWTLYPVIGEPPS